MYYIANLSEIEYLLFAVPSSNDPENYFHVIGMEMLNPNEKVINFGAFVVYPEYPRNMIYTELIRKVEEYANKNNLNFQSIRKANISIAVLN